MAYGLLEGGGAGCQGTTHKDRGGCRLAQALGSGCLDAQSPGFDESNVV